MSAWHRTVGLALAAVSLAGCSPFVGHDQLAADPAMAISLRAGETLGQTFVARQPGLDGVEIFLWPEAAGGEMRLHLRADPQAPADLALASLPLDQITAPAFYRFAFTPQAESGQHDYYVLLEIAGAGGVRIGAASGTAYLDGAAYQNDSPLDAQMTFRLVYELGLAMQGWAREALTWVGLLGAGALLYVLPGWGTLSLLWPQTRPLTWPEQLALSIPLSLAVYPLLFLWTDLLRVHLGALYAWLPLAGGLALLLWHVRSWRPAGLRTAWWTWLRSEHLWPDMALLGLLGLVFLVRFLVVRPLDAPLWGDSYQHATIAQLLVDHRGLFDSWKPYADLESFTYHFGFHAAVAVFHWVTGMALPGATLWVGQILNGLAALALYPLASRLGRNPWAGVCAVLLAGLLSPMPMFYVNWGRYTQLAGQAILPGAIYLAWAALETQGREWRGLALAWMALGGLALSHYRILVFAGLFVVAFLMLETRPGMIRPLWTRALWLAGGAGVLFLPWLAHIFAGRLATISAQWLTTPPGQAAAWTQQYNAIGDLFTYLPPWMWLLLPLCIAWGLWGRRKEAVLVSLWWFLALLVTNPQWLRLPGEGVISNFALFIAAYIPAGILEGAALGWLVGERAGRRATTLLLLLGVAAAGLWGARQRLNDLRLSDHALVTRPDLKAAAWIQAHTPEAARFLTNSFFAYGSTVIVGSDGGWWLPLLARRQTTVPPLSYEAERGPRPDYVEWVNALTAEIQNKGLDDPSVLALLRERGISHVYIGQRQGRVNYGGPVLDPQRLLASPHFRPVYHQDRVWIFAVLN